MEPVTKISSEDKSKHITSDLMKGLEEGDTILKNGEKQLKLVKVCM